MKIRWRLLILLLVIGLVPLLFVAGSDSFLIHRLGADISRDMQDDLRRAAVLDLSRTLHAHTRLLDRERRLLEQLLRQQAEAVERRLAGAEPRVDRPIYLAEDFDAAVSGRRPGGPPPGLTESDEHEELTADGSNQPKMVSYEYQAFLLAHGVTRQEVEDDLDALADMTDVYGLLHEAYPEAILWQYTSLASGVHSIYPGKGGYPADYNPRLRQWYLEAERARKLTWATPTVDLSTGSMVLTVAIPVHRPDGSFAGVTAIDTPLELVLRQGRMMSRHSSADAELMLVTLATAEDCRLLGMEMEDGQYLPLIFAASSPGQEAKDWRQSFEYRPLTSDDPSQMQMVIGDMQQKLSQTRVISRNGHREVWAYSPIDREDPQPAFLLYTLPEEEVIQGAASVATRVDARMWLGLAGKGLVLVMTVIAVGLIAWKGAYVVTNPVTELAEVAHRIADGDLEARAAPCTRSFELGELAHAFNTMIPKLRDRLRIRQSLNVAMEVQQSLLPAPARPRWRAWISPVTASTAMRLEATTTIFSSSISSVPTAWGWWWATW